MAQEVHSRLLFYGAPHVWGHSDQAHIVLEARVVAGQHDARVGAQALKVGCVSAVSAHEDDCGNLHQESIQSYGDPFFRACPQCSFYTLTVSQMCTVILSTLMP